MNYYQELCLAPICSLNKFRKSGLLCDVELVSDSCPKPMKVHSLVLANYSDFFLNIKKGDFSEKNSTVVKLDLDPDHLWEKIIDWMYTGNITVSKDELMPLYYISHFYGIELLEKKLNDEYKRLIKTNLLSFIVQLDNKDLNDGVQLLYSDLAADLESKTPEAAKDMISKLSPLLYCQQFAAVISEAIKINTSGQNQKYVSWIDYYYADYAGGEEEKQSLNNSLKPIIFDQKVQKALGSGKHPWYLK